MSRLIALLALLFGAFCAAGSAQAVGSAPALLVAPGAGEVRALVVGIDHYANVNALHGAVADARDIESSLKTMGSKDVTTLIDERATRANLLAELDRLVVRSHSGDLVMITLAGHGAREGERQKGSSPDGSDQVFLLVGFDPRTGPGGTEKLLNHEFHHFIKQLEAKGAQVIFVADTCYGGGLAREVAVDAPELTYRQTVYRLAQDDLKPVSTPAEAYLSDVDFDRTTFLAAVDSETKAPEIPINGVARGALSYAFARAVEGAADEKHDGKITMRELFSYTRKVVYQLSEERQNIVTVEPPNRDIDREVVLQLGAVAPPDPAKRLEGGTQASAPKRPVRLASLSLRHGIFDNLHPLQSPFEVVDSDATPDLVWNPVTREAIVGGDTVALDVGIEDLPGVIDRTAAVRDLRSLVVKSPQKVVVLPDAGLHRKGAKIEVEVDNASGRGLILVDITGSGTVQMLYPRNQAPSLLASAAFRVPFVVRDPYGDDEVLAITSEQPMDKLADALRELDNRRSAGRVFDLVSRFAPSDASVGLVGLFTAP